MRSYWAVFIIVVLLSNAIFAQTKKMPVDEQLVVMGDELYNFGSKKDALELYIQATEMNSGNLKAQYMAGKCYLETIHKHKAVPFLLKAYELNNNVSTDILYKIGQAMHYAADFNQAIKYYTLHRETLTPAKLDKMKTTLQEETERVNRKIFECKNGLGYYANPGNYKIENMGATVNSEYKEYAPAITASQDFMIFTARREGGIGKNKDIDNDFFEDVWYTRKLNGTWQKPKNMGKTINTETHDASIGFSPDGKILFLYKPDNGGDIYFSNHINDTTWSTPQNMGTAINSKYAEPSVCISADGRTLYFSSDRPGGFGGLDLYKSEKLPDGRWDKPVNLGSKINTKFDDDSPYIDIDGKTLYFSSKGHKGMGGYDIYKATFDAKSYTWSEPENLGYPINTPDNDIFFVIAGDGKTGYYSSVRDEGFGDNDIYMIHMLESATKKEELQTVLFKGIVMESENSMPIQAELLVINLDAADNPIKIKSDKVGNFHVKLTQGNRYALEVQKDGYLFYSENLYYPTAQQPTIVYTEIKLKKIQIGQKIILKNVFFDVGKTHLRPESEAELQVLVDLLQKNKTLKIEVGGHSDNVGASDKNKIISTERAKSVYEYLIKKGVDSDRLRYRGYGEDVPITTNDTEEGRQKNRRTEFEIVAN